MRDTLISVNLSLPNSPVKPALLSVLGSVIACTIFLGPWHRMHRSSIFGAYALIGLAIFAAGAFVSLKFVSELKHGVENERWPEAQIEPLRAHLESPYYTALSIGLLVAFVVLGLLITRFRGEAWGCFLLGQNISQLRLALKRPRHSTPPIDWRSFGPLHSDHWGQR